MGVLYVGSVSQKFSPHLGVCVRAHCSLPALTSGASSVFMLLLSRLVRLDWPWD